MNFLKTLNRIILIVWSTIAVMFVIWFIVPHISEAQLLFEPAVNYGAGDGANSVAIGDLNGDDKPDLAVANNGSHDVSVLLGNGDGTFNAPMNYAVGDGPQIVATDDLNGDGDLDLAVSNYLSDDVSVLLGNGDGSFQIAVEYGAGNRPMSVATDDLNGDDKPDLVVANEGSDDVSVLMGNGDGTFQDAVNYAAGIFPYIVAIGDLNGDDKPDLAVANQDFGYVSVLLGNGDGTFQAAVKYDAGDSPHSVAIGDLNGDSKPDLAVAIRSGVSVLLGNGDGSFQSAVNYGAGADFISVAIGDLDGDGDLDLAVANLVSNNASVLLGKGDGAFQAAESYATGVWPNFVAIGDLDVDGNLDLATSNNLSDNVSILINTGGVAKLLYSPATPCKIVDTRNTSEGMIGANTDRDFHVYGDGVTISAQGGNSAGCPAPLPSPSAAHINMVAVNPTGKGNIKVFPADGAPGGNLGINFANIGTNFANAGTVETNTGSGPNITVASNFSSAHVTITVLGYYYPDGDLLYTPVTPCKIVDTRNTSAGMIGASTQRNFHVHGNGAIISAQGGNTAGCLSPLGEPFAVHLNSVAVNPTGKGNMKIFPVGGSAGANFGINFAAIGTNFANAGIVETDLGLGPEITVASNYSSTHAAITVLGYYYQYGDFSYTPVTPCKIVDTRNTSAGMIGASTDRDFHVFGDGSTISAQGGNSNGCIAPGEPLAAHINMVAVNPTGKGNIKVFPADGAPGGNLGINFANIGTNFANAGTVETSTGFGPDITVASNFSSAHVTITVLGYYYSAP